MRGGRRHGLLHGVVAAGRSALLPDDPILVAHIRRVLEASPFHGEGDRKAWARKHAGRGDAHFSKERVRRLMREHDLQAPPRAGPARMGR